MNSETSNKFPKKVKPINLIKFGLDPAVLWNVDRYKEMDSHIFIVSTLIRGYNDQIILTLTQYFGDKLVIEALIKYRNRVSNKLFTTVQKFINKTITTI